MNDNNLDSIEGEMRRLDNPYSATLLFVRVSNIVRKHATQNDPMYFYLTTVNSNIEFSKVL